ncbi:MAG: translation initiation factor IF-3 [Syntrophales bacterium]|nr:translation initiation factor IF-3 [Syntrophales bacterium]
MQFKNLRVNEEITAPVVRLIAEEGKQLGIFSIREALERAAEAGLDLVEVAPTANPPVCRIMDYGKYRYQQSKKLQDAKKSQAIIQVKEIRLRPKTEAHDLKVKIRHIRRFLEQKDKVKVTMMFRGREIVFADMALKTMEEIVDALKDVCVVDQQPKLDGRNMVMVLSPKR